MLKVLASYLASDEGVTAIEYGVIAAAMGVALVIIMPSLTSAVSAQFSSLGSHIASGK